MIDSEIVQVISARTLSNRGSAFLNCWFKDNLETEIRYAPRAIHQRRQMMALVFATKKGGLGCNFGSQCVEFSKSGKPLKRKGAVEATLMGRLFMARSYKFKLTVKKGSFEAFRDGRQRAKSKYSQKRFDSGRIGIVWGGGIVGMIDRLQIVGRLDYQTMLKVMQKSKPHE